MISHILQHYENVINFALDHPVVFTITNMLLTIWIVALIWIFREANSGYGVPFS